MQQYFTKIDTSVAFRAEGLEFDASDAFSGGVITVFGLVWSLMTFITMVVVISQVGEVVPVLIVLFFVLIGILLMVYGSTSIKKYLVRKRQFLRIVKNGEVTIGKVIEIDVEKVNKSHTLRMKYCYKDRNGRSHTRLFINTYQTTPPYKLDQDVHVLFYDNYSYILNQYRPMD